MRTPGRYLLAASFALVVAVPPAAADPPAAAAPPPVDAAGSGHATSATITLVTGERVVVDTRPDGRSAISVVARDGALAPAFHEHERDGHVYVVPADVAALVPDRLDWSLFDVTKLARQRLADGSTGQTRVLVDPDGPAATGAELPGATVVRSDGDAALIDLAAGSAAQLGAALALAAAASPGAPTVLDGIEQIRLAGSAVADVPGSGDGEAADVQMVNLTVTGIARDGRPAGGISSVDVINVDDRTIYEQIGVTFAGGSASFSVPAGRYAVLGYLFTYDEPSVYAYEGVATFEPEVTVATDTTVTLDARDAVPIEIETPDPIEHTTTTLSYWRQDALGASYSHSFTLSNPINTVFANPTDPVTTGDFEFYTQRSLVAPDITAYLVEPDDRAVDADYVFSSAKLNGSYEDELVYVGLGRVEDYEGVDVQDKIALIRRGEITFLEKMQNATAAGARVAMIFNNVPGLLLISGDPSLVPTMAMSQAEGESLVELLESGQVVVHLDAVAVSPYLYDLVLPEADQVPAELTYTVDETTTAHAKIHYTSHVPDQPEGELRHKWRPWEGTSFGFQRQMPAPLTRQEFISSGDTRYQQYFWGHSTLASPFDLPMYAPLTTYAAGDEVRDKWIKQVVAPAAAPPASAAADSAAYRVGDTVVLDIPEWVDRSGHWGFAQSPYDSTAFRLYEDDDLVASSVRAGGSFAVGAGPATLRLELDVDRTAPGWVHSARTRTVWEIESSTAAQPVRLPLLDLQMRLPLTKLQQERPAKAGLVRWVAAHQAGSATAPITGSQLWVSYDAGETWAAVDGVEERKDGHFRAQLPEPPDGAETVSLRVQADDDAGGSVWQEVVPAYALGG